MNSFEKYERMGLPGGPNEVFTYTTGVFDSGSIIQNTYRAPSNIHGQGMFAGKAFKRGDLIGLAHEDGQPASELGRMHNHSENDATMVSNKVGNQRFVYAARDIQPGEELTTNYRLQPELEQPEDFMMPMAQQGGDIPTPGIKPITYYDMLNAAYPGQYDFITNTQRYYGDEPSIDPRTQTITSKQIPFQYDFVIPIVQRDSYHSNKFLMPPIKGTNDRPESDKFEEKIRSNKGIYLDKDNEIIARNIVDDFLEENIQDIIENPSEYYLTDIQPSYVGFNIGDMGNLFSGDISDFLETKPGMPEAKALYLKRYYDDSYEGMTNLWGYDNWNDEISGRQGQTALYFDYESESEKPYRGEVYERLFDLSPVGIAGGRLFELAYRPGYTQYDVATTEASLRAPEAPDKIYFDRDKFMTDAATANQRDMRLSQNFLIDYLEKEPSRAGKTYYYYDDDEGNILYAVGQPRFGAQGKQTGEEQEYLRQFEQFTNKDGTLRKPKVISSKDNPKKFQEVEDRIYDFAYQNIDGAMPTFQGQSNPGGGIMRKDLMSTQQNDADVKKYGGSILPMAQRGLEKYQTKGELTDYGFGAFGEVLPNEVLTMANAPEFFNNQAVYYRDDSVPVETEQRYNDMIREKVYAGTHGYNPVTKQLVVLDNKTSLFGNVIPAVDVDPVTQVQSTREYGDVIENSYQPMFDDRVYDYIETLPADQREAMEDYYKNDLVRGWVASNNAAAFRNPIMYAPGLFGLSAIGGTLAAGAGSGLSSAMSAPLTIGSYVNPYITMGNLLNAGFAADFLVNRAPKIPGLIQEGNYGEAALEGGLGALDLAGAGVFSNARRIGPKAFNLSRSSIKPNRTFQSEIDWGKWNEEIPLNKELMQEYHTIEEVTKAKGTWMKNPDGSAFEGPPELFVQTQSNNFLKAFPDGYIPTYRGMTKHSFNEELIYPPLKDSYTGVFTGNKPVAEWYGKPYYLAARKTDNSLNINAARREWTDIGIYTNKADLENAIKNQKKLLETVKGNDETFSAVQNRLDDLELVLENWDEGNVQFNDLAAYINSDKVPLSYFGTDEMAKYLEEVGLDNALIKNVYDGEFGDVLINNQVPGNYLKSLEGNNGMFDMTNPSMYKQAGGEETSIMMRPSQPITPEDVPLAGTFNLSSLQQARGFNPFSGRAGAFNIPGGTLNPTMFGIYGDVAYNPEGIFGLGVSGDAILNRELKPKDVQFLRSVGVNVPGPVGGSISPYVQFDGPMNTAIKGSMRFPVGGAGLPGTQGAPSFGLSLTKRFQQGGGLKQKDPNRKYNNTISPSGKTGYAVIRDENLSIPNPNEGKYIYNFNFQEGGEETKDVFDIDQLKKGVSYVESQDGLLMMNPESTATGLYGQLFSEFDKIPMDLYSGTREEFAADLDAQNRIFEMRVNDEIEGIPGLMKNAYELTEEYLPQLGDKFNFTLNEVAALSNFLGRQGARKYFGNVLRDGMSLEEVFPDLYSASAEQANKTPEEYIEKFRQALKEYGGEMELPKAQLGGFISKGIGFLRDAKKAYDEFDIEEFGRGLYEDMLNINEGYTPNYENNRDESKAKPFTKSNLNDFTYTQDEIDYINDVDNGFICTSGGCLARAYTGWDNIVASRFSDVPGGWDIRTESGNLARDGNHPTNNRLFQVYNEDGTFRKYDKTTDSWDQHGVAVINGGVNHFTLDQNKERRFTDLSEAEQNAIYDKMTPGTIIGWGDDLSTWGVGFNTRGIGPDGKPLNLFSSRHSTIVVGKDVDGVPLIYDYDKVIRVTDPILSGTYNLSQLTNVTTPKSVSHLTYENLEERGLVNDEVDDFKVDVTKIYQDGLESQMKPFYNALKDNKISLMNDLRLSNDDYNLIANGLLGLAMIESGGGSGVEPVVTNVINDIINSKTLGFVDNAVAMGDSVGLTQLNWDNIKNNPRLFAIAKRYGITSKNDLLNPTNSAIASVIFGSENLSEAKRNYEQGLAPGIRDYKSTRGPSIYTPVKLLKTLIREKQGKKLTFFDGKFKTEDGTIVNTQQTQTNYSPYGPVYSTYDRNIEDIQADLNDLYEPNEGIYYEAKKEDGEIVIYKYTLGNSELNDLEKFIYNWNSPNTLRKGDAYGESGYLNAVSKYINIDDFNVGGEVGTKPETYGLEDPSMLGLALYKDYIDGNNESEAARKNYDTFNARYYKQAKQNNTTAPDYIMSEVFKLGGSV